MKLSVIIPLYNVENHVETCISSLLKQNLRSNEYEILVIDDGSTDGSVDVVEKFKNKHSNIFIYKQKNGGVGSARNKGIALAKGKYIYFIDPDDYLASNVFSSLLKCIEENDLEILTFSSLNTTETCLNKSNSLKKDDYKITAISGANYIGEIGFKNEVWWYIIKRSFIEENSLKFIEGRWMEDAIFTADLFLKAKKIAHLPIDAHRHVKVEGSAMLSKEPEHYIKVIKDNANAAKVYSHFINEVKNDKGPNLECINRLEARQQSFVFFLMVRMLKSKIRFKELRTIINEMIKIEVYPLNKFIGKDYNGFVYKLMTTVFNIKSFYYIIFLMFNPFLRQIRK